MSHSTHVGFNCPLPTEVCRVAPHLVPFFDVLVFPSLETSPDLAPVCAPLGVADGVGHIFTAVVRGRPPCLYLFLRFDTLSCVGVGQRLLPTTVSRLGNLLPFQADSGVIVAAIALFALGVGQVFACVANIFWLAVSMFFQSEACGVSQ